jgi:hypothetical protein
MQPIFRKVLVFEFFIFLSIFQTLRPVIPLPEPLDQGSEAQIGLKAT